MENINYNRGMPTTPTSSPPPSSRKKNENVDDQYEIQWSAQQCRRRTRLENEAKKRKKERII